MIFEILLRSKCQENCFKDHLLPFQTENLQKKNFLKTNEKIFFWKKTDFWISASLKVKNVDI